MPLVCRPAAEQCITLCRVQGLTAATHCWFEQGFACAACHEVAGLSSRIFEEDMPALLLVKMSPLLLIGPASLCPCACRGLLYWNVRVCGCAGAGRAHWHCR